MAGTTNFLQFNPSQANQETDAAYLTDSVRTSGAGVDGIWPSDSANKTLYQASTMVAALAQMLANKGFSVSDANYAALVTQLGNILTTADGRGGLQNLIWSSTISLNAATFQGFAIPLQGSTALSLTGVSAGALYVMLYTQDSAGGHTVTFGTGFGANAVQPDPAPYAVSAQVFMANAALLLVPIGPLMSSGGINGTPIGSSTPSTGVFSSLQGPTVSLSDSSTNAATTAWVRSVFSSLPSSNGYVYLAGGIILQWAHGTAVHTDSPDPLTQIVSFPIAFPTACFVAGVSTQIGDSTADGNCMFQTVGAPTTSSVFVTFQIMTDTGSSHYFTPIVFAVGN